MLTLLLCFSLLILPHPGKARGNNVNTGDEPSPTQPSSTSYVAPTKATSYDAPTQSTYDSPSRSASECFESLPNIDINPGIHMSEHAASSPSQCEPLCSQTAGCRAYTWVGRPRTGAYEPTRSRCYLKRQQSPKAHWQWGTYRDGVESGAHSGVKCPPSQSAYGVPTTSSSDPYQVFCSETGFNRLPNIDINTGIHMSEHAATSPFQCEPLCIRTSGCIAFTWVGRGPVGAYETTRSRCYLKTKNAPRARWQWGEYSAAAESGAYSGVRCDGY